MARPRCRAKIHEMRFQGALLLCPQPMSHSRCRIRTRLGWKPPPLPRPPSERCSVAARPGIPRRTAHGRRGGRRRCTRDLLVRGDEGSPTRDAVAAKQHMRFGRGPQPEAAPRGFRVAPTCCRAGATGPLQRSVEARCRAGATPRLGQLAVAAATRSRLLAAAKRPST